MITTKQVSELKSGQELRYDVGEGKLKVVLNVKFLWSFDPGAFVEISAVVSGNSKAREKYLEGRKISAGWKELSVKP